MVFDRPGLARYRLPAALALVYLVLQLVLRLVLWWVADPEVEVRAPALAWILPAGTLADLVEVVYLLLPCVLWLWLLPQRWYQSRAWRVVAYAGSFCWLYVMLFSAVAEYFFFQEFNARFNLVAVHYLIYPKEILGDIRAEYPLGKVLLGIAVLSAALVWLLRGWIRPQAKAATKLRERSALPLGYLACWVGCLMLLTAYFTAQSDNRVANELAMNGAATFFRAVRSSDIDYPHFYATRPAEANFALLQRQFDRYGGTFTRLSEGRLDRSFPARPEGLGRLNVVVLMSESFGAEFSRLYGSDRDWTPNFDRFAQRGIWFRHTYASGTRTVRGLEAVTSSFPPIPSESIVRRLGNDNIATWGKVMRGLGYSTTFLYGGYGYFDNMNAFYAANGFEVLDRTQIPKPVRFENIWGVADEDLYDMSLRHFDGLAKTGKPFFAMIMNTSNHKPFTFRQGVPGVKPKRGGRQAGVRYADFATGYLLEQAEKHDWFRNTVFVVIADHGARVYGRADIPLKSYEIPFMIYSPAHIKPRRVDALTAQIDVAPTVLGLLGLPYTAPFFGSDVLNTPEEGRVALFSHNYDVALLRGDKLAILGLQKTVMHVRYDRDTDTYTRLPDDPELTDLAIAYYQTAYELFAAHKYE